VYLTAQRLLLSGQRFKTGQCNKRPLHPTAVGHETNKKSFRADYWLEMLQENLVKCFLRLALVSLFCALCAAVPSFAAPPVRGSSQNGVDSIAPFWNLAGPTGPVARHGGTVMLKTQVVCTHEDVAAAVDNTDSPNAGGCVSGGYTYLFQLQSTATNLTVTISGLVGFTPLIADPGSTYGVAVCDNDPTNPQASNTLELCTHVSGTQLSNITASVNNKNTKITFVVPSVPNFSPGVGNQGQGLTLVVVTEQKVSHPISLPKITFK
jgi:hypothetical protein